MLRATWTSSSCAGVAERITSCLSARLADRIRALPGVAAVDGRLTEMVSLGGNSLIGVPLHGLNPSGFAAAHYALMRGRPLRREITMWRSWAKVWRCR